VGKGGLIAGGAYGRGEVYQGGEMIGFADLSQATIGAQAGGQEFSELIAFESQNALDGFKQNKLRFAANASAVALKSGTAKSARYDDGVAVFIRPTGGLMVEAAIGGQSFSYLPKE
jgi:lipid-binding SYLF domain-containing protein